MSRVFRDNLFGQLRADASGAVERPAGSLERRAHHIVCWSDPSDSRWYRMSPERMSGNVGNVIVMMCWRVLSIMRWISGDAWVEALSETSCADRHVACMPRSIDTVPSV